MNLRADSLFSLKGKTVLLTGASGYLGRVFGRTLLENGAHLIALGRSGRIEAQGTSWANEFGRDRVNWHQVDMYDLIALERLVDNVLSKEPFVEILVNNAYELGPNTGFNTPEGCLEAASYDQWTRSFTCGVYWPALMVRKLGPAMKERRRGSIVNIATMYANVAPSPRLYEGTSFMNPPAYSAAKAGLVAFTRYVASFWGKYGIRANAILPGAFSNTEDSAPNAVELGSVFLERLAERTALGRIGRPDELAGALLFLASDAAMYITGHALVVDGGWTIT